MNTLYVVSLLLAAKVEEAVQPNFDLMLKIMDQEDREGRKKSHLIEMEAKVLVELGFEFDFPNPQTAVERHLHLLGYDKCRLISDMAF